MNTIPWVKRKQTHILGNDVIHIATANQIKWNEDKGGQGQWDKWGQDQWGQRRKMMPKQARGISVH